MEYDFYIMTDRGALPLTQFASVFHVFSGRLDSGEMGFVPSMTQRTLSVEHPGGMATGVYYGDNRMHKYPITEKGLNNNKVWHASVVVVTALDFESDMSNLMSVPGTGCVFNPDDGILYTSPSECLRRSFLPAHVTVGQLYE